MQGRDCIEQEGVYIKTQVRKVYLTHVLDDEVFRLDVLFCKQTPGMHSAATKAQVLSAPLHSSTHTSMLTDIWHLDVRPSLQQMSHVHVKSVIVCRCNIFKKSMAYCIIVQCQC